MIGLYLRNTGLIINIARWLRMQSLSFQSGDLKEKEETLTRRSWPLMAIKAELSVKIIVGGLLL